MIRFLFAPPQLSASASAYPNHAAGKDAGVEVGRKNQGVGVCVSVSVFFYVIESARPGARGCASVHKCKQEAEFTEVSSICVCV